MHAFRPRIAGPEVSVTDLLLFALTRNIYGAERLYYRAAICWKDGFVLFRCFWFGNSFIVKTSRDDYAKYSDRQNGVLCTFVYLALEINFPLLVWLSYLKGCKGFVACIVYRTSRVFHGVDLDGTDFQDFIVIIVAPILNGVNHFLKTGFVLWLNCFRLPNRQTDCQRLAATMRYTTSRTLLHSTLAHQLT